MLAVDSSANTDEDNLTEALRSNLTRLIAYAKSADPGLQRQVAEKLANEAVKRERRGVNSVQLQYARLGIARLRSVSVFGSEGHASLRLE